MIGCGATCYVLPSRLTNKLFSDVDSDLSLKFIDYDIYFELICDFS